MIGGDLAGAGMGAGLAGRDLSPNPSHTLEGLAVKIRTTKDNLLIGDTCHPINTELDLDERLAERLVYEGAAEALIDSGGGGQAKQAVAVEGTEAQETAATQHGKETAAKRR